ncbi:MAG: aspartyl protease family protein [Candidatus Obscuribacterales bacterium]|nr:aspartyl protease family protein [Candidatus Obscuribacterales bacterium]
MRTGIKQITTAFGLSLICILGTSPEAAVKAADSQTATNEAAESDLFLEPLLNKIYLAYGGQEALAKLGNNCLVTGEVRNLVENENSQKKFGFRRQRRQESLRIDIEDESGWTSTVYDGLQAWRSENKKIKDADADETKELINAKDHEPSVLSRFNDPAYKFVLRGSTLHRAVPVYAIEVSRSGNAPTILYIDKKNYLVLGLSYVTLDPATGKQLEMSLDYAEYRPAAGSLVPFKQVEYAGEQAKREFSLQTIELNTINDDQPFRRPDRPNDIRLDKALVIPFLYSHKEILVKVKIGNSEPLDFLFDTGASQTLIDRRVAAENLLDRQANLNFGAAGGNFTGQATEIEKLELGSVTLVGIQAAIVDLSGHARQLGKPIAGVLGTNVLNHFAVSIDYGKSVIRLRDYATYKPEPGSTVVAFTDKKGPIVKAIINGKEEVSFLVDTGAAFNNLPPGIAKKYASSRNAHYTEGIGVDGKPVRLGTLNIASLKLGTTTARDMPFTYSVETDSNKQGFVTGSNTGILGNPFWQNFTLTMDYRAHQIVLQANPLLAARQQLEQLVSSGDNKLNIYRDFRAAESAYQAALAKVQFLADPKQQARLWGRLGNLRRIMAKDLSRPEQARVAYEYFSKAQSLAHKMEDREIEGRILADWALLYLDNGQMVEARQALDGAMAFCAQDPQVNVNFAVYLNKLRSYGDMRAYIDKALFLEPSNWQALWYRLKLAETFGDMNLQKDTLKEIVHYYPWSKIAQDKLRALTAPQPAPGTIEPLQKTPLR